MPLVTPDGRYIVVRGRLWRRADPSLDPEEHDALVSELGRSRAAKKEAKRRKDAAAVRAAADRVDAAKRALGERGPVWWDDGAPDLNRHLARTTPYAGWYGGITGDEATDPEMP